MIIISTAKLTEILRQLNENGFKASIFALKDGLPLASHSINMNEKIVAAISAMVMDTIEKVKTDFGLSKMINIKINLEDICILMRNLEIENKSYILAGIADKPQNDEVERYNEQLLDWAEENGRPVLEKLGSI